jgi:hypothetical protein
MTDNQRKRLFVLADELNFTREERLELASVILGYDVRSWSRLTDMEADRIIDCFVGFERILFLISMRPKF